MNLRQLEHFVAVFEQKNLSKAAEAIPLSQPALTRSVRTLEDQVGVELFLRHARGATPTPAGERLYHHAKSILAECARAKRDARQSDGEIAGTVAIGIGSLFASHIIDNMITRFCEKHPNARLRVHQGFFEDLVNLLETGEIEVAFNNLPLLSLPDNMEFEPLLQVHSSVIVSAAHALANTDNADIKELSHAKWATVSQPHALEVLDSLFISEGVAAPQPAIRTNSLTLIKSLVMSSNFVCLLPDHLFSEELSSGEVVRLPTSSTPVTRSAGLLFKKDGFRRPVANALGAEIQEVVSQLSDVLT